MLAALIFGWLLEPGPVIPPEVVTVLTNLSLAINGRPPVGLTGVTGPKG